VYFVAVPAVHAFNEPDNFMGIKFWQELVESETLKTCRLSASWEPERETGLCFTPGDSPAIKNVDIGLGRLTTSATADLVGKKLARLQITFQQDAYPTAVALFKERYGAPTKIATETVTTKAGLNIQGQAMLWTGKRLSIVLRERGGDLRIDRGEIVYETDLWQEHAKKRNSDWIKQKSKGF
jgi:hypothetical protein